MYQSRPSDAVAVTKSDVTTYAPPLQGLYVGTTGHLTLTIIDPQGNEADVVFSNVPVGTHHFGPVKKVKDATTAANIVGLLYRG
jgi:hypothetical protein